MPAEPKNLEREGGSDVDREPQLVEAVRRGDHAALARVYALHQAALRVFATRYLRDRTAAEDVVHDVFVGLPNTLRGFRGDSSLRTFLFSVTLNHARHVARSRTRGEAASERVERTPEHPPLRPDEEVERKRLAAALQQALETLPPEQREAFLLCEVEELASREVAAMTGVPEGTVRTRLFHARKRLRGWLESAWWSTGEQVSERQR